jgi:hypothetical protein
MLQCLNLTLKDIQLRQENWHWRFLEKTATAPTVIAQMDYDLPTIAGGSTFDIDGHKIFAVFDRTQDLTYVYKPYEWFVKRVADPSNSSGNSVWWTYWAGMLKLWPVPASVWTFYMNCIALITALTDAGVACEVPAKYDSVIIHGALKWAYQIDPKLGSYADMESLYEKGIASMKQDNSMMIAEIGRTESHRNRYEGKETEPFPLSDF